MHLRNILLAVGVLALLAGVSLAIVWFVDRPSLTTSSTVSAPGGAGSKPAPDSATAERMILVAAQRIPAGTPLRDEDVAWKGVSAAEVGPDEILRVEGGETAYRGAFTRRDFAAGEPLLAAAVVRPTDRGFLAAVLAPGMRAVSIPVEPIQSMSALIMPANRVDIILTQTFGDDAEPGRRSVGETILANLRVIAVDQRLGTEVPAATGTTATATNNGNNPRMITLEVTERQAETLLVASRMGKVEIAVRASGVRESAHDGAAETVLATWASDVSPALNNLRRPRAAPTAVAAPVAAAPATAPAQRARQAIEVMHGSKLETR